MVKVTTPVYHDKRYKFEAWCFNTIDDGFVEVHRFEDRGMAEKTHLSLSKMFRRP